MKISYTSQKSAWHLRLPTSFETVHDIACNALWVFGILFRILAVLHVLGPQEWNEGKWLLPETCPRLQLSTTAEAAFWWADVSDAAKPPHQQP